MVEEILQDRIGKSGVASSASLLTTWRRFQGEAFGTESPVVEMLPVTVCSLVVIGSKFKRSEYRSFPNYVSAIKAVHIEAGHQWSQLLTHTSGWVTPRTPFHVFKPCNMRHNPAPIVRGGPQPPVHLALLSTIFLLR